MEPFNKGEFKMGLTRKQLIAKGEKVSVPKLLDQGRVHLLLLKKYLKELNAFGWSDDQTGGFEQGIFDLDTLYSSRSSQTEAVLKLSAAKAAARQTAKSFIRRLRLAAPIVIKKHSPEGITESAFNAGGPLGSSASKISKYLMQVRPFVKQLDELFKPHFNGKSAAAELEAVKSALDKASAEHKTSRSALPEETANIYFAAGGLLDTIEEINRIGKIAFDGHAEIAAQFNKDLTLSTYRVVKSDVTQSVALSASAK
jgi:hypothetical protein